MKRLGKRLFRGAAALLLGLLLPWGARAAWVSPFVDVTGEDWFYPAVEYVVEAGLFQGTAPDRFSPAGPMTRGMFVTVLGRAVQVEGEGAGPSPFEDVGEDAYYAPYVAWAAGAGVVNGTSPTTFSPEEQVTREQMAVMLYQYGQAYDLDVSFAEGALDSFPDGEQVSPYAREAMAWAVTHGVLQGSDGVLDPQGAATRAQTAQIFRNARDLLAAPGEDPEPPIEEPPVEEEPPAEEESPVEEEPPAEEEPPVVDLGPQPAWLEAQRAELEGGARTLADLGVTRAAVVGELAAHLEDRYYLGTPYLGGDYQSPNGDTAYNGRPAMNCGGFVSYVLRKAGLRAEEAMRLIKLVPGESFLFGSGRPYDLLAGASNYRNLVKNGDLEAYVYGSAAALLASGQAERGDVIFVDKGPDARPGGDTHLGFYWGPEAGKAMWHSGGDGNVLGPVTALNTDPIFVLIKTQ